MRLLSAAVNVGMFVGAVSLASADPSPQPASPSPTTQPALAISPPTTQPIAPSTQPTAAAGPARLLLLPFTAIDPSDQRDWIGRGILASLQSDLSRLPGVQPITIDTSKSENAPTSFGYDTAAALKLGRSVDARYVIYGTYQTVEPELRLVGFILDTETGRAIGGIKATGSLRDIFGMEDSLGTQAKRQLPQLAVAAQAPVVAPAAPAAVAPPVIPAINPNNGPVRAPLPPAVVFDDDAARRAIDKIRYHDDSQDYYPPFSDFGYGPFIGYWTPSIYPVSPFRGTLSSDSSSVSSGGNPFRGNNYISPTAQSGNYIRPTAQSGNYIHATPQSGNYVHATPQSGNSVAPIPQRGNYVRPTPQSGNAVQPTK